MSRRSVRRSRIVGVVRALVTDVAFRIRWRAALARSEIHPSSLRVSAVALRDDKEAVTVTIRSRTTEGAEVFSERGLERLAWALNRRVVLLPCDVYAPTIHRLLIERQPFEVGDLPMPQIRRPSGTSCEVLLGRSATEGELVSVELWNRERGSFHVLVAGTTGGGKSNTVNVLLAGLIAHGVCIVGLDCKSGETLAPWEPFLGCAVVDPVRDPDDADALLARLVDLMEQRHRSPGANYQPIVLVVEEWASLPTKPTSIGDNLERLAAQGRSASIGLIVTTQRPTSNVGAVRTSTRGNLPLRIAHSTVGDRAASEAILGGGEYGAAELPTTPPGHALVRAGGGAPDAVRVFRCPGPLWLPGEVHSDSLDVVEAWDKVAQRELGGRVVSEHQWSPEHPTT